MVKARGIYKKPGIRFQTEIVFIVRQGTPAKLLPKNKHFLTTALIITKVLDLRLNSWHAVNKLTSYERKYVPIRGKSLSDIIR